VRKRAVTDGRIEGSTLAEKRRWQQHKKGGKQTTKRGRKKGGKPEKFARAVQRAVQGSRWQRNAAGTTEGGKNPKKTRQKERRKRRRKQLFLFPAGRTAPHAPVIFFCGEGDKVFFWQKSSSARKGQVLH
jgi:hypothetical protein